MVSVSNTLTGQRDRQTGRETDRYLGDDGVCVLHSNRQTGSWVMETVSNTLTARETDRQVERQTGTWVMVSVSNTLTDRQTGGETERETGRETDMYLPG